MLILAAAATIKAAQIPFWLQVGSIIAAPILGFTGVAVGVLLNEKNRRAAYLTEEKKKAYIEFTDTIAAIMRFWSYDVGSALKTHRVNAERITESSRSQFEDLLRTFALIRLVGSQPVADAGVKWLTYTSTSAIMATAMLAGDFDQLTWNGVIKSGNHLMRDFTNAARKDLGLPILPDKAYVVNIDLEKRVEGFFNETSGEIEKKYRPKTTSTEENSPDKLNQLGHLRVIVLGLEHLVDLPRCLQPCLEARPGGGIHPGRYVVSR